VPPSGSHSIVTIRLRSVALRVIVLAPAAILALLGCWFAIHWYIGDTIAEFAPRVEKDATDVALMGAKWAPDDPLAHLVLGDVYRKESSDGQLADALREYRLAVSLAPNDYRFWMQLGRALEASGDSAGGEQTLRRAVELAPAYSFPRWYLGNLLLRTGKQDEAFRELVRAAQADPQLLPQVFNLTWNLFDGNVDEIARITCPTPDARIQLALYLAKRKEFASAARVWAAISARDRQRDHEPTEELKQLFLDGGRFHNAADVMRDLDPTRAEEPEKFVNAGFENDAPVRRGDRFGWVINSSIEAQISVDRTEWHSGRASLKVVFRSPNNLDVLNVSQLVIVEPDTNYRLECYARTRDLVSGGTPFVQIVDAMDHTVILGTSEPLPDGTNDWQLVTIEFRTAPEVDGVLLKLGRAKCGRDLVCPIFGSVWYDDFSLKHSSGPAFVSSDSDAGARHGNEAFRR